MKNALQALALIMTCSVIVTGCGRKGPPEPPPSSMIENEKGEMVQKPKVDKPFVLDRLIK